MRYRLLIILCSFALFQCAKQTAPTGGPKDETPPKLVGANPKNKTANFKESEIQLTFDEFVQLNNPKEQIIITPSIGKKFEATAKKNKVILKLNADLKEATTYTINFRESIQDITEKNPTNVKIAFSTGTYIDSLSISGTVTEILTNKLSSNYTVGLVEVSDTFNILKHPGTWITLTDKQGKFEIENLKPSRYFIYGFDDKNKNLLVDSKSENYGFQTDIIDLTKKVDSIKLITQRLDASKLKLISSKPIFTYYTIRVSKSLTEYTLTSTDQAKKIYSKLEPDRTTIKVYNTIQDTDSLQVRLEATDSIENKIDSLIYVKFDKKSSTKDALTAKLENAKLFESNSMFTASVTFSKPITQFKTDSAYIQIDSATRIPLSSNDLSWKENLTKLSISKKIDLPKSEIKQPAGSSGTKPSPTPKSENRKLYLGKGSFISLENDTASVLTSPINEIKVAEHAIVSISTKSKESLIVQLLDMSFKLVEQTNKSGTHKFENVTPGSYMLRVIVDLNKNGKWDTGNFFTKQQPEPIFFYTNPKGGREFILKANWYVGDLLITY